MYLLDYDKIPGFSKLFVDFVNFLPFFAERFPTNKFLNTAEFEEKVFERHKNYNLRENLYKLVKSSMQEIVFSTSQKANLELLRKENVFSINTGQQVGFLGGAFYTFLKCATAIEYSKYYNSVFQKSQYIPIFWVEDNDDDIEEASNAYLMNYNYEIQSFSCEQSSSPQGKFSFSRKKFEEAISGDLEIIKVFLNGFFYFSEIEKILSSIYFPDKGWSQAFVEFMNLFFAEDGILFIKASLARKSGIFKEYIMKELEEAPNSFNIINEANKKLEINGYHIQAKVYPINLFIVGNGKRAKIEFDEKNFEFYIENQIYNRNEVLEKVEKEPEIFTPNVILRPIFQDYILPSAINICGPSEIGYISQLNELYQNFNIKMPAFVQRHSATILDKKISNFLNNYNLNPLFFYKSWNIVEQSFYQMISDMKLESDYQLFESEIKNIFENFVSKIDLKDKTYIRLSNTTFQKVSNILNDYRKKLLSLKKKEYETEMKKLKQVHNLIYPRMNLQERFFSPLYFIAKYGLQNFKTILKEICKSTNNKHIYWEAQ